MDERLGPLFVALLVVAALGAAAATFDDPDRAGGGIGERTDGDTDLRGDAGSGDDYDGSLSGGIGPIGPGGGDLGRGIGGVALPLGLAAAVALWVGLAVAVVRRATGDDRRDDASDAPSDDGGDVAAGTTSEPPWRPTATDGVTEAWVALVRRVDVVARRSHTPGEVAERAIGTGYRRDGVRELTTLFERVRYGAVEPTADRVAAARDALARSLDGETGSDGDARVDGADAGPERPGGAP